MIGYLRPARATPRQRCLVGGYHCALCHELGAAYGFNYRLFARPDLVFYNIFLDAAAGQLAPLCWRRCVLVPFGRGQRTRSATSNTRLAAAFGLLLLVEKLRDDYQDEGGPWRWLLWRLFEPGGRRAAAVLTELGCDAEAVAAALRAQAAIERGEARSLEEAAQPTIDVARLMFAQAGAAAVGECVGRFLFFMDNLLDLCGDLERGRYNALAAAFGIAGGDSDLLAAARSAAIAGARAALAPLPELVAALPASDQRNYVASVLVDGLADRLHRYQALDDVGQSRAQLRDLVEKPPRPFSWVKVAVGNVWQRLRAVATTASRALAWRADWATRRAALASAVALLLLPVRLLAQDAGGSGDGGVGGDGGGGGGGGGGSATSCGDNCGDSCSDSCSQACSDSCEQNCSDSCSRSCNDTCDQACSDACSGFTCC
ncbi:MAG: hypothetical protein JXR83_13590 [Deltaproteobacteria bacterium]|nr:hypothetical protein [Deltaproteobacteria bacterium]